MTCVDIEGLAAEYVDGTLGRDARVAIESHLSVCPECKAFVDDAGEGAALLGRLPEIEPPHELVTLIAFHAPVGRARDPLASPPGWLSRLTTKWVQPLLQPRFAMSMAMTIFAFGMLQRCTGVDVQHLQAADLTPAHLVQGMEDKAVRVRDRAVKYYENIRLVYDVETRLHRMEREREAAEQDDLERRANKDVSNGKHAATGQPDQRQSQETGK